MVECDVYQKVKYDSRPPIGLLQSLPIPNKIWEDLTMDLIEGLPISGRHEIILVIVDRLSMPTPSLRITHTQQTLWSTKLLSLMDFKGQ